MLDPQPVPGCPETLKIADDYGDNEATMQCQKPVGHTGDHLYQFNRPQEEEKVTYVYVTWHVA